MGSRTRLRKLTLFSLKSLKETKNVLADTLTRLIEIDDDIKLPAEQEGHEFGYIPFEQLPPAQVTVTEELIINEVNDMKV